MKMVMRVQKAQVPSVYKWTTPGAASWNKYLAVVAGYTEFDVCMIGAAAGNAGDAYGKSTGANVVYGSGGGGGGMLSIRDRLLKDLAMDTNYTVGAAGRHGNDSTNTIKAENGISGGNSVFGTFYAEGGRPSIGGRFDEVSGGTSYVEGTGGAGGGNSLNLYDTNYSGAGGGQSGTNVPYLPTQGAIAGNGTDLGGKGGGGGMGRVKQNGTTAPSRSAQDGAIGNGGFSAFLCPGAPDAYSLGGCGGGANLRGHLGTGSDPVEYYGTYQAGANANGVVQLRLK